MRRHPNWSLATAVLSRVIAGATDFTPDQIPGLSVNRWQSFRIDDRDPDEVTAAFLEYCRPRVTGLLIIVTLQHRRGPLLRGR
ncbi:hypothetical protein HUT06_36090 [Actinomadura sp. NAK00032]|uniref:hypothetical protein n=1 Tax=Actinomadura sp. NAK00032 TaxID=2742128 RepID=UPI001592920D|nr:hypothetical protein [Actinomadura sp. NAK00032]QKW38776.1 hypothetical protein HUT06_36090 [Actinomadura sp. NAK00032]